MLRTPTMATFARSPPATLAMAIAALMATFADDDGHHSG
jgi:hypothetical protein